MPTVRQYFYKSIKNFFLVIGAICAAVLVVVFIGWITPAKAFNEKMFYYLYFLKEIGIGVCILIVLFFGYRAFRIYKTQASFSGEVKKMSPTILIWLLLFGYGASLLEQSFDNTDCQKFNYNAKLNGGVKEFNGKKYTVNICGSGVNDSHFFGDKMDTVKLTITNEQGDIVSKRRYKILWEAEPGHQPITIGQGSITYQDDERQKDYSITMPPTMFDWVRARLPLFSG